MIDPKLKAFLSLIAWSEGTSIHPLTKDRGYDVIVTGINGPSIFTGYSEHPFAHHGAVTVREHPLLVSTACGRYQALARWWNIYREKLNLPDFSPDCQDAVAVQQIRERGVVGDFEISDAIHRCSNIWASFPGNSYGQGGHVISALVTKYKQLLEAA